MGVIGQCCDGPWISSLSRPMSQLARSRIHARSPSGPPSLSAVIAVIAAVPFFPGCPGREGLMLVGCCLSGLVPAAVLSRVRPRSESLQSQRDQVSLAVSKISHTHLLACFRYSLSLFSGLLVSSLLLVVVVFSLCTLPPFQRSHHRLARDRRERLRLVFEFLPHSSLAFLLSPLSHHPLAEPRQAKAKAKGKANQPERQRGASLIDRRPNTTSSLRFHLRNLRQLRLHPSFRSLLPLFSSRTCGVDVSELQLP